MELLFSGIIPNANPSMLIAGQSLDFGSSFGSRRSGRGGRRGGRHDNVNYACKGFKLYRVYFDDMELDVGTGNMTEDSPVQSFYYGRNKIKLSETVLLHRYPANEFNLPATLSIGALSTAEIVAYIGKGKFLLISKEGFVTAEPSGIFFHNPQPVDVSNDKFLELLELKDFCIDIDMVEGDQLNDVPSDLADTLVDISRDWDNDLINYARSLEEGQESVSRELPFTINCTIEGFRSPIKMVEGKVASYTQFDIRYMFDGEPTNSRRDFDLSEIGLVEIEHLYAAIAKVRLAAFKHKA